MVSDARCEECHRHELLWSHPWVRTTFFTLSGLALAGCIALLATHTDGVDNSPVHLALLALLGFLLIPLLTALSPTGKRCPKCGAERTLRMPWSRRR